jgi:hypothetical protein
MQLQLIIGYRGMEKLAWQSGEVESIDAEVVYENDTSSSRRARRSTSSGRRRSPATAASDRRLRLREDEVGGKLARFLTEERHREDPQLREVQGLAGVAQLVGRDGPQVRAEAHAEGRAALHREIRWLRLNVPKPWMKLSRGEQQRVFDLVTGGNFDWLPE